MIKMIREGLVYISQCLPDYAFAYITFAIRHRYLPRFRKPRSFSEKVTYIRLFGEGNDVRRQIADRLEVRNYVKRTSPSCKLVNIYWVGSKLGRDVWSKLPSVFVLKANHGSGMVRVVDKERDSYDGFAKMVGQWLKKDYAQIGREWFYENLGRYVIAEEFLETEGSVPPDFKFFCMSGRVEMVQVDTGRFSEHKRNLYDRDFNLLNVELGYPRGKEIPKPRLFSNAVSIAEELSQEFSFVRVDLYILNDGVYFGELTNIPGNGLERFDPLEYDFYLGSKLDLKVCREGAP